jgi:hypothetical protein
MRPAAAFGFSALAVIATLVIAPPLHSQGAGKGKGKGKAGKAEAPAVSVPHDPKDLRGVWRRQGGVLTMSNETPPMTAWGKAKFDATKPVYGARAVQGGFGNDPMSTCDPLGMPRNLFLEVSIYPYELQQLPDRVYQFFEWAHSYRVIWTDGRELPKDPDPQWMGYSVGKWEGDVFVVKSLGFDERTWLDHFGNPVSDDMTLEERYHRVDRDTLEAEMVINAPKAYTKPWVSEKKVLKLVPKGEIQELFCVPTEEQRFNELVRDPGSGIVKK